MIFYNATMFYYSKKQNLIMKQMNEWSLNKLSVLYKTILIKDKDEDESLFTTFPIIYEIAQSLIQKFEIKLQKKTYKSFVYYYIIKIQNLEIEK